MSIHSFILKYSTLARIIFFSPGGCKVTAGSEGALETTGALLGVDKEELRESLTSRIMQASRGGLKGTVIK